MFSSENSNCKQVWIKFSVPDIGEFGHRNRVLFEADKVDMFSPLKRSPPQTNWWSHGTPIFHSHNDILIKLHCVKPQPSHSWYGSSSLLFVTNMDSKNSGDAAIWIKKTLLIDGGHPNTPMMGASGRLDFHSCRDAEIFFRDAEICYPKSPSDFCDFSF